MGVAAWLLGVVTATTGSMIAVNELAHGLFGQQTQQLGGATINADLAAGTSGSGPAAAANPADPVSGNPSAAARAASSSDPPAAAQGSPGQGRSGAGKLLESSDGSVLADCQSGNAYLLSWWPDPGFQAEDVYRGPAATTSVTFAGSAGSVVMRVTCQAGVPIAHLYRPADDDGVGPDE